MLWIFIEHIHEGQPPSGVHVGSKGYLSSPWFRVLGFMQTALDCMTGLYLTCWEYLAQSQG